MSCTQCTCPNCMNRIEIGAYAMDAAREAWKEFSLAQQKTNETLARIERDAVKKLDDKELTKYAAIPSDPNEMGIPHGGWYIGAGFAILGFLWFIADFRGWVG